MVCSLFVGVGVAACEPTRCEESCSAYQDWCGENQAYDCPDWCGQADTPRKDRVYAECWTCLADYGCQETGALWYLPSPCDCSLYGNYPGCAICAPPAPEYQPCWDECSFMRSP